jgi:hypothetical protein
MSVPVRVDAAIVDVVAAMQRCHSPAEAIAEG